MTNEYYIVKLQGNELLVWYPSSNGFKRTTPTPYFSIELAKRVHKRITQPIGKYNPDYVKIVDLETFAKLQEKFPKWEKKYRNPNLIRGANYNEKGEIRGANYNERGHTEVGKVGWMKYRNSLYNTKAKGDLLKDS